MPGLNKRHSIFALRCGGGLKVKEWFSLLPQVLFVLGKSRWICWNVDVESRKQFCCFLFPTSSFSNSAVWFSVSWLVGASRSVKYWCNCKQIDLMDWALKTEWPQVILLWMVPFTKPKVQDKSSIWSFHPQQHGFQLTGKWNWNCKLTNIDQSIATQSAYTPSLESTMLNARRVKHCLAQSLMNRS